MNQIPISEAFLGGMILYATAGLVGLICARQRNLVRIAACALAALGAVLEGVASFAVIKDAHETIISISSGTFFLPYTFRLDPLSCYFNLALAIVGLAISIYSFGYLRSFDSKKPVGVFCF